MVFPILLKLLLLPIIGFDFSINRVLGEDATLSKHKTFLQNKGNPLALRRHMRRD